MSQWTCRIAIAAGLLASSAASAQYPILDMVADRVVKKYQSSTCEQLWQNRGKQSGAEEQKLIALLRGDPKMREHFFNRIAPPVVNKMFECGMIP